MKDAKDVIPWAVTDISTRPYDGYWSFNPSIHFDGATWRCVLRCCDYAMPNGVTIRSKTARSTGQQTKNAMVILDPATWRPISVFKMLEQDDYPRASTPHLGYEDMRIFRTERSGLQGIAASLHLRREGAMRAKNGMPQHQPPEQVLVSFDAAYNIVAVQPIRGDWSGSAQKNWAPYDNCAEPRFLYSIGKGTMFDDRGKIEGPTAVARASLTAHLPAAGSAGIPRRVAGPPSAPPSVPAMSPQQEPLAPEEVTRPRVVDRRTHLRGGDVQIVRGRRIAIDTLSSRPSAVQGGATRVSSDATRVMGGGRLNASRYSGLRGGTQLVRVGDDEWLGVGHDMEFVGGKKRYWHVWYVVDARGKLLATSEPIKFAPNGIEFAAGMGIDGDRVVVSFGVDDMACRLGETRLSAVMEILRAI